MNLLEYYKDCRLCPRQCGIDRSGRGAEARSGFCGEGDQLRVAHIGPHHGEEPPISGRNGSGTVFFTGCSLLCSFCQNYQISHQGMGMLMSREDLLEKLEKMIRTHGVHNINFVTPDHFFPHVFSIISVLREKGLDLPMVFNLSGYQSVEALKPAEDYADIYLPDFKYADTSLAMKLSKCKDYPETAIEAIAEMVRQKGFLDTGSTDTFPAKKGVLVRHLILPGRVENSIDALTSLFIEFGRDLPLSLMSQYHPVLIQKDEDLNGFVSMEEFDRVYLHATGLGFEHLFVQFPERQSKGPPGISPFLPNFQEEKPFETGG
ncbi:MAG: radical SAM protein [Desulfobacterales bacterium]|nr:radical SAM protein [Desulfobacterales bacterium]